MWCEGLVPRFKGRQSRVISSLGYMFGSKLRGSRCANRQWEMEMSFVLSEFRIKERNCKSDNLG